MAIRTARALATLPGPYLKAMSSAAALTVLCVTEDGPPQAGLTEADRRALWDQFVTVYSDSQKSYDGAVRALAAAGLTVTVSIGTALKTFSGSGVASAVVFLTSLSLNFLSYATAQLDMKTRISDLHARREEGIEGNNWTRATTALNLLAGIALLVGGGLLSYFVATST
ncbi:MAG: hypothetical protein ACXVR9_11915 [Gaiellaceae bacterium]